MRTPRLLPRLLAIGASLVISAGAAGVLAGAFAPWAVFTAFKNIDLGVPGLFFVSGGLCLAASVLILLRLRRWPVACLVLSLLLLYSLHRAQQQIPRRLKYNLIGAQMALFPINRLLDQFHIRDIEVANWTVPDEQLLGPGLAWTRDGVWVLLLGGLLGLPGDPAVIWLYTKTARVRCRACGARWPAARQALYCPECGESALPRGQRPCSVCHTIPAPADRHCIACGSAL